MPSTQKIMDDMLAASGINNGNPLPPKELENTAALPLNKIPRAFLSHFGNRLIGLLQQPKPGDD